MTRQTKAARWFQWKLCPWNRKPTMTVKMVSEITSCITFSCTSVKGPPLPMKPMRFAGTAKQYSMKAMLQEKAMTPMRGQLLLIPASCKRR